MGLKPATSHGPTPVLPEMLHIIKYGIGSIMNNTKFLIQFYLQFLNVVLYCLVILLFGGMPYANKVKSN